MFSRKTLREINNSHARFTHFKIWTLKDRHLLMLFSDYRRPLRVHARAPVVVLFAASAYARSRPFISGASISFTTAGFV